MSKIVRPSNAVMAAAQAAIRQDSWFSAATTQAGHIAGLTFAIEILSELYDRDWLAKRIVKILPSDALRPGWYVCEEGGATEDGADEIDGDEVKDGFEALNNSEWRPEGVVFDALCKGRLHGGAAIILGFDSDPLTPAPEPGSGKLLWLDVVRRDELIGIAKEDDQNSPNFGRDKTFRLTGMHNRRGLELDGSRLMFCEGEPYESRYLFTYAQGYRFPWTSVLQPVMGVINSYGQSWQNISHLLKEMSIMIWKMSGFKDAIMSDDGGDLDKRLQLLNTFKSIHKTIFLEADGKEDVTRTAVSFADMPALMQQWSQIVSAAADMPVTRLFGISPAGLNATGESDMRQWYDRVAKYQRTNVKPKIEKIASYVAGQEVEIAFKPLWEPTATEQATIRQQNAAADKTYFDMGAVEALEVAISRANDGTLGIEIDTDEKKAALEKQLNEPDTSSDIPPGQTGAPAPGTQTPPADGAPAPAPSAARQ